MCFLHTLALALTHTQSLTHIHSCASLHTAIKEERYRYGNGYDQVEDVMGVAQPVRFNSKSLPFLPEPLHTLPTSLCLKKSIPYKLPWHC